MSNNDTQNAETVATCMNCGLPLTRNRHALAGKMSHLNILGAEWGCLPCAEIRANGRAEVFSDLKSFLLDRIRRKVPTTLETVLGAMEQLEFRRLTKRFDTASQACGLLEVSQEPPQPPPPSPQ